MLYGIAFRILRNREEAEDAVQEVFIKMWKMGDQIDKYRSIEALATTILKNYCIDQIRKQSNILIDRNVSHENSNLLSETPLDVIEQHESENIIGQIIERLPEAYRNILILHEIEGLDYNEIAEKTNQNINTLRVNLSRARVLLRDEYKKYYNEQRGIKQAAGKVL
jgi:RNA polymerase sigma-70 factor (ECF subfamily)